MKYFVTIGFLVSLFSLGISLYSLKEVTVSDSQLQTLEVPPSLPTKENLNENNQQLSTDICGQICLTEIQSQVSTAIASLSGSISKPSITSTLAKALPKTSYVSFDGTFTTTQTDWLTIDATQAIIDIDNEYGKSAYVTFSANLKVTSGSGGAFIRLYDDTNKISVSGSELSTSSNINYKFVESGKLAFWKGRNTYKIQIKSLDSQEVSISNAKVKISY